MSGAMSDEKLAKLMGISDFYGFPMEIAQLLENRDFRMRVFSIMRKYKIDALLAIQVSENPDDEIEPILDEFVIAEVIKKNDPDNEAASGAAADVECPIEKFKRLIEDKDCRNLKYGCLIEPLTEIIGNRAILAQMCEENPEGFIYVFDQHFIEKHNTFRLVEDPIKSMAMEFVMRKWH